MQYQQRSRCFLKYYISSRTTAEDCGLTGFCTNIDRLGPDAPIDLNILIRKTCPEFGYLGDTAV